MQYADVAEGASSVRSRCIAILMDAFCSRRARSWGKMSRRPGGGQAGASSAISWTPRSLWEDLEHVRHLIMNGVASKYIYPELLSTCGLVYRPRRRLRSHVQVESMRRMPMYGICRTAIRFGVPTNRSMEGHMSVSPPHVNVALHGAPRFLAFRYDPLRDNAIWQYRVPGP